MTHLVDASWADVSATLVATLERRRAGRRVRAAVVAELVLDGDGVAWIVEQAIASRFAATPRAVLLELARALEAAAAEQETAVQ